MNFIKKLFGFSQPEEETKTQEISQPNPPQPSSSQSSSNSKSPKKNDKQKDKDKEKKPKREAHDVLDKKYILPRELIEFLDLDRKRKLSEGKKRLELINEMIESQENRKKTVKQKTTEKKPKQEKNDTAIKRIMKAFDDQKIHLSVKDTERVVRMWNVIVGSQIDDADKEFYRNCFNKLRDKEGHIIISKNTSLVTTKPKPTDKKLK